MSILLFIGYSIFVIMGRLPESEADQLLKLCPAKPEKKPPTKTTSYQFVNKSDLSAALQQATTIGKRNVLLFVGKRKRKTRPFLLVWIDIVLKSA